MDVQNQKTGQGFCGRTSQIGVEKNRWLAMRKAQLVAEAVAVVCPFCGEAQPDGNGSEMWTPESFLRKSGKTACVACEKPFVIASGGTARFTALSETR